MLLVLCPAATLVDSLAMLSHPPRHTVSETNVRTPLARTIGEVDAVSRK